MTPSTPAISRRALVSLALGVLLLQAGLGFVRSFPGPSHPVPPDFGQFYSAALALRAGEPEALYFTALLEGLTVPRFPGSRLAELAAEHGLTRYSYYVYPPWVAAPFVPVTFLSPYRALALFYAVNWLLAAIALLVLARMLPRAGVPAAMAVAFLLLPSSFLVQAMVSGQTSVLVLLLLVLFARAVSRGRDAEAGVWWALMAGIKLFPVFLLPFLAIRRKWRLLGASAAAGLGLLAVSVLVAGIDTHVRYLEMLRDYGGYTTGRATNWSVQAVLMRWGAGADPRRVDILAMPGWVEGVAGVFGVLTFALTAWVLVRGRRARGVEAELTAVAVMVPWVFSSSPFAWSHHMVALALPLALVAAAILAGDVARGRWLGLWLASWAGLLVLEVTNRVPESAVGHPGLDPLLTLPLLALWLVFGLAAALHLRLARGAAA